MSDLMTIDLWGKACRLGCSSSFQIVIHCSQMLATETQVWQKQKKKTQTNNNSVRRVYFSHRCGEQTRRLQLQIYTCLGEPTACLSSWSACLSEWLPSSKWIITQKACRGPTWGSHSKQTAGESAAAPSWRSSQTQLSKNFPMILPLQYLWL